jgi:hypothetical protein
MICRCMPSDMKLNWEIFSYRDLNGMYMYYVKGAALRVAIRLKTKSFLYNFMIRNTKIL